MKTQAEAEVVPSSSLVEVEVGVEVEIWAYFFGCLLLFRLSGWVGGWGWVVGQVRDKAIISTQVVVEVEVGVELGNSIPVPAALLHHGLLLCATGIILTPAHSVTASPSGSSWRAVMVFSLYLATVRVGYTYYAMETYSMLYTFSAR